MATSCVRNHFSKIEKNESDYRCAYHFTNLLKQEVKLATGILFRSIVFIFVRNYFDRNHRLLPYRNLLMVGELHSRLERNKHFERFLRE